MAFRCCLGVFCVLLSGAAHAELYRVFAAAPNGLISPGIHGYTTVSGAWNAAVANTPGDHTILLEEDPALGYTEPQMTLGDGVNIEVAAQPGFSPDLKAAGDHPLFRVESTTGNTLTVRGASPSVSDRITLRSNFASPLVDCGAGTGTADVTLRNLFVLKETTAPDGEFVRLDNTTTANHTLDQVGFFGGDAAFQSQPILVTGSMPGNVSQMLIFDCDFTPSSGSGPRILVQDRIALEVQRTKFGFTSSVLGGAPAFRFTVSAGGRPASALTFRDCEFRSGDLDLFDVMGSDSQSAGNLYTIFRPVFTGKCGSTAFNLADSKASLTVQWVDDSEQPVFESGAFKRVDFDPMILLGTLRYARVHRGAVTFKYCKGLVTPNAPSGYAVDSSGGTLSGFVDYTVVNSEFGNGAGTYNCGAIGGFGAPRITVENSIYHGTFNGGGFLRTLGGHTANADILLRHATLTGTLTSGLIDPKGFDVLTLEYALLNAANAPGGAAPLTPVVAGASLSWDGSSHGFASDPGGLAIANPFLTSVGRLTAQSTAALGAAMGSGMVFDYHGDPRPLPAGVSPAPDIGADEADFRPQGVQFTTPPAAPGSVGDTDPNGTLVGTLIAQDPDPGDTHTFTLADSAGGRFKLENGNEIQVNNAALIHAVDVSYTIQVQAADSTGKTLAAPQSLVITVGDSTAPFVTAIDVMGAKLVDIFFSEGMNAAALDAGNYALSGAGRGSLPANPDAVTQLGPAHYRLSWESSPGEMVLGGDITITVSAVLEDTNGNPITAPLSATDAGAGIGIRPSLLQFGVATGTQTIEVSFSEAMDEGSGAADPISVLHPANYVLAGGGTTTLAANPDSVAFLGGATYELTWNTGDLDLAFDATVTVDAMVRDLAGNAINPAQRTAIIPDSTTPPTVQGISAVADNQIEVTFSKPMGATALDAGNYTLLPGGLGPNGMGSLTATPDSVTQLAPALFRIAWAAGEMLLNGSIKVRVENVFDILGLPIDTDMNRNEANGFGFGTPPQVTGAKVVTQRGVLPNRIIEVTFSEELQPAGTAPGSDTVAAKYTLSGPGQGTLVANPATVTDLGGQRYRLQWTSGSLLDGGDITVSVANVFDLVGNPIGPPQSASVTNRIAITVQPAGAVKSVGDSHTLSLTAAGGDTIPLTYQWVKNGNTIVGGNAPVLAFPVLAVADSGSYVCYVKDSRDEEVDSTAVTLTVQPLIPLSMTLQPVGGTVRAGENFTFTAAVTGGTPPYVYQWYRDDTPVGGNAPVLVITAAEPDDAGSYRLEIFDAALNSVVSNPAALSVNEVNVPAAGLAGLAALSALLCAIGPRRTRR